MKNSTGASAPELANSSERNHHKKFFSLVDSYLKKTTPELASDLIIEVKAENKACYFIMESDFYEQFRAYCERRES